MALLLIFNADSILGWFHGDMTTYRNWLYFIIIGTAVNSVLRLASLFLRLSGYAKEASIISNRILIISIIATPLMIYFFGIAGAIVSLVGIHFIRGLWYSYQLKALHGITLNFIPDSRGS
jgi:Na+-driven multidrug efflux pump